MSSKNVQYSGIVRMRIAELFLLKTNKSYKIGYLRRSSRKINLNNGEFCEELAIKVDKKLIAILAARNDERYGQVKGQMKGFD